MNNQEVVESKRLIMRRLMPEDYKVMAAWDMDERVYKYLLSSACKTPEEPLAWLPKKDPTSKVNILMLVSDKEDGHAVGIYALNHDVERDVWSLSYVNRYDDWGKGYTVEGMSALMEHAVKVYGACTFEGECAKENIGSRRVMEKLGMVYDHSSSYTKNDGSTTFESDIFTLTVSDN
jgi:RimJ/RimL family protein N-acetyltransferase